MSRGDIAIVPTSSPNGRSVEAKRPYFTSDVFVNTKLGGCCESPGRHAPDIFSFLKVARRRLASTGPIPEDLSMLCFSDPASLVHPEVHSATVLLVACFHMLPFSGTFLRGDAPQPSDG